ncbi:unnamed protein product [Pieris macdunnoughi]|uniref:Uncharacterized protein n=1 Tax=Pieris macdunnoughi TaxID=345717 RepID=A0A821U4T5_9NEOP|nr:unnamed protein product [Pieris macdunnoughi]
MILEVLYFLVKTDFQIGLRLRLKRNNGQKENYIAQIVLVKLVPLILWLDESIYAGSEQRAYNAGVLGIDDSIPATTFGTDRSAQCAKDSAQDKRWSRTIQRWHSTMPCASKWPGNRHLGNARQPLKVELSGMSTPVRKGTSVLPGNSARKLLASHPLLAVVITPRETKFCFISI